MAAYPRENMMIADFERACSLTIRLLQEKNNHDYSGNPEIVTSGFPMQLLSAESN